MRNDRKIWDALLVIAGRARGVFRNDDLLSAICYLLF
jgi:hypothetical protein